MTCRLQSHQPLPLINYVRSFEIEEYTAIVGDDVSDHILARMSMVPDGGSKFLQEHEDLDEWPDLDDDSIAPELGE